MQLIGSGVGRVVRNWLSNSDTKRHTYLVKNKRRFITVVSAAMLGCTGLAVAQPSIVNIGVPSGIEAVNSLLDMSNSALEWQPSPEYWQSRSVLGGGSGSSVSQSHSLSTHALSRSAVSFARVTVAESRRFSQSSVMAAIELVPKRCEDRRLIQWPAAGSWNDLALIRNAATLGEWGEVLSLSVEQLMSIPQHSRLMVQKANEQLSVQLQALFNYQRRLLSFIWP